MVHGVRRVHARLGDGLAMTSSHHLGGAIGCDAKQGDAGVKRLGQSWTVVEGCCPRGAHGRNRSPRGQSEAERVVRRRPFVDADVDGNLRLMMQRKNERSVS